MQSTLYHRRAAQFKSWSTILAEQTRLKPRRIRRQAKTNESSMGVFTCASPWKYQMSWCRWLRSRRDFASESGVSTWSTSTFTSSTIACFIWACETSCPCSRLSVMRKKLEEQRWLIIIRDKLPPLLEERVTQIINQLKMPQNSPFWQEWGVRMPMEQWLSTTKSWWLSRRSWPISCSQCVPFTWNFRLCATRNRPNSLEF